MTTTSTFEPLTLDKITLDIEHYGVKAGALGVDGDMGYVVFTHDERRAIAVLNRHFRQEGLSVRAIDTSAPVWWQVFDNCGCGENCQHTKDGDGYADHDCDFAGLPPCREDEYGWMSQPCTADAPNALPVIECEVDAR